MSEALVSVQAPLVMALEQLGRPGSPGLPSVGGKAANLGVLAAAGFPVPPGFCLTTRAYQRVAAAADLDQLLAELAGAQPDRLAELAAQIRSRLRGAPVPADIADAVTAAYADLGPDQPVAVRSSATAEDLPFASFAGQQDTFLNVVGAQQVLAAVGRCWASLWTERAVAYRGANGIDHASVQLAVVVQQLVDPVTAGVLFTANPVTGRRGEAVIDASFGLGEAVVSGAVNPDHFEVDSGTGVIRQRRAGEWTVAIRPLPGGGTEHVQLAASAGSACLADRQVVELARVGARVERHYGHPQDIEWAIDAADRIWLTQARPITTLFPLPEPVRGEGTRVYLGASVLQGVLQPITPLGLSGLRMLTGSIARLVGFPVAGPTAGAPLWATAAGRIYFDFTAAVRNPYLRRLLPKALHLMEARSARLVAKVIAEDPRLAPRSLPRHRMAAGALRVAWRTRIPLWALAALTAPATVRTRARRLVTGHVAAARQAAQHGGLPALEQYLYDHTGRTVAGVAPLLAAGFASLGLVPWLVGRPVSRAETQILLRGLEHNPTTEMDLDLWRLAERLREDAQAHQLLATVEPAELADRYRSGTLPAGFQRGLAEFLDRHGYRAVAEIDAGVARWSEDPRHILGALANYQLLTDPEAAPERMFQRGATEARAQADQLVARARHGLFGPVRAVLTAAALRRVRALVGMREVPKQLLVTLLGLVRAECAAVGRRLAEAGVLARAEDVYLLDLTELAELVAASAELDRSAGPAGRWAALVEQRRAVHQRERGRRHLPRVLLSDGTEPAEERLAGADDLVGAPASPGTVTGVARVVLDPVGARLEPGEILVAPSTDPGWTPLFLTAGGLVMEMGGANSHGSVVAREYGIPAVVGVADATGRIVSGQRITVDGTSGVITVVVDPTAQVS